MKKIKTAVTTIVLTSAQSKRLTKLEATIEAGRKTFIDVGTALAEIRDAKLYLATHKTFEAYCVEKWQFKRAHAHRIIAAAKIAKQMSPVGDVSTERSARALLKVPEEKREAVVKAATDSAKSAGRTMTTKDLTDAAKTLIPAVPKTVKKKDDAGVQTGTANGAAASTDKKVEAIAPPAAQPTPAPVDHKAKSDSTVDKLHELWLKATPIEREDFLKIINAQLVEPALAQYTCNNCGDTFDDDTSAVSLYKCDNCEGAFTAEISNDGDHECPHCNNPGEKISDYGCPSCKEGVLEKTGGESL